MESARASRRRLLQARVNDDQYGSRENRLSSKRFKNSWGYRSVDRVRGRLDDDADYDDQDEEDEEGDIEESGVGEETGDKAEDDEEEDDEETIGLRGTAKGRWSPKKRARETRADYAAITFEGKQEVDEPERNKAVKIRSVMDDCDEDSTEPLQYYDYESRGNPISEVRIVFAMKLATLNILFYFLGI
ncbi:uncharacterized protein LOC128890746 [Hylaeus anthracinus]|uniref:uncharacterized protein LOC128890746 n=1 Tax=Hylaeus anthracinus TaxID=313031 RepID=UPI0023B98F64|nr:uncharacterized protein LOC128890746 [Hylaeus anthracinus]